MFGQIGAFSFQFPPEVFNFIAMSSGNTLTFTLI
jgi:hypothetical protein